MNIKTEYDSYITAGGSESFNNNDWSASYSGCLSLPCTPDCRNTSW